MRSSSPFHFGIAALLTFGCDTDPQRRRAYLVAAPTALALALFVFEFGVPYVDNGMDQVSDIAAVAILLLGPVVLAWPRVRRVLAAVMLVAYLEPVLRVEYLTWRHGSELRRDLDPNLVGHRLFSVTSYSETRATAFSIETFEGPVHLELERRPDGRWQSICSGGCYPLLWYQGNSDQHNCIYPLQVLLATHFAGESCP